MTILERPVRTPLSVVVVRVALLVQILAVLAGVCLSALYATIAFAWFDRSDRTGPVIGLLLLVGLGVALAIALMTAAGRLRARPTRTRLSVAQAVLLIGSVLYTALVPDSVGLGTTPDVPTVLGVTAAVALLALATPSCRAYGDAPGR